MLRRVPTSSSQTILGRLNSHFPRCRRAQDIYGASLCAAAAGLVAFCLHATSLRTAVIFPFLLVVIFVALHFGATAAIIGTTLAAAIFSRFMLPPLGSFLIEDVSAKERLLWFVVAGVTLGYLFAPVPPDEDGKA